MISHIILESNCGIVKSIKKIKNDIWAKNDHQIEIEWQNIDTGKSETTKYYFRFEDWNLEKGIVKYGFSKMKFLIYPLLKVGDKVKIVMPNSQNEIIVPLDHLYAKKYSIELLQERKLNQYITVKLYGHRSFKSTLIFIDNKYFMMCFHLILNLKPNNLEKYDEIRSIDEIINNPIYQEGNQDFELEGEQEFIGHCSNLEVWIENDYNTEILDSHLSFPILKKLSKLGDKKAQIKFKEEIARRISSEYFPTIRYLCDNGYLKKLSIAEITSIADNIKEPLLRFYLTHFKEFNEYDEYANYRIKQIWIDKTLHKKEKDEADNIMTVYELYIDNCLIVLRLNHYFKGYEKVEKYDIKPKDRYEIIKKIEDFNYYRIEDIFGNFRMDFRMDFFEMKRLNNASYFSVKTIETVCKIFDVKFEDFVLYAHKDPFSTDELYLKKEIFGVDFHIRINCCSSNTINEDGLITVF
jgi:DNA-binding Xre family transcriptional regulator